MKLTQEQAGTLSVLVHENTDRFLGPEDFRPLCETLGVAKLYYDMNLGDQNRYRDRKTNKLIMADDERGDKIYLYDSGEETDLLLSYPYYYNGVEFVHSYVEFKKGVRREDLDTEVYEFIADLMYLIISRQNMRRMLDFAESSDMQTGIPNNMFLREAYRMALQEFPAQDILMTYINLQNFKYINESANARAGDEAIIQYAHKLMDLVPEHGAVCRMGGDNFVAFLLKKDFEQFSKSLSQVTISDLKNAPNRSFEVSAWIGVSEVKSGDNKHFGERLDECATACNLGKSRLKKQVVFFSDDLRKMMGRSREILAMFRPAVENHELTPFYQAKVDMRTGELVGFEALCRWIHNGQFIYPDQFIPILDKEGLIHEVDMTILRETCAAVRRWKDMGLKPPRISVNFSRKNLFVPDIEEKILQTIRESGLDVSEIEIEITETVQTSEYQRLIAFISKLHSAGCSLSVDDFGTGYSSLSLIHNIDADVIKIDKSFVDEITTNEKSFILISSIISIAQHLKMQVIAEGVETEEQKQALMQVGCNYAQGYLYSKPVDYEAATQIIRAPQF